MAHDHEFGAFRADENTGTAGGFLSSEPKGFYETGVFPDTSNAILSRLESDEAAQRQLDGRRERNRARVQDESLVLEEPKPLWNRSFSFGAVVNPQENTLRGYKRVLRIGAGQKDIEFSPGDYQAFDGIIARMFANAGNASSPAVNLNHPDYQKYAPLRRNIAILRNYLLVTQFPDGVYSPGTSAEGREDAHNFIAVQQMATRLGAALSGGRPTLIGRFFRTVKRFLLGERISAPYSNTFLEAANVPDVGIGVMYEYLFGLQYKPSFRDLLPFTQTPRTWGLVPREQTPFSVQNIDEYSRSSTMQGIAAEFDRVMSQLRSVDSMRPEDRKISVDIAREILEKLRILIGNGIEENKLDRVTDAHLAESRLILKAAYAFKDTLAEIAQMDPLLLTQQMTDPAAESARLQVAEAIGALEQLSYRVKAEAWNMLTEEGKLDAAAMVQKRMLGMPPGARTATPTRELIARLNTGINEAVRLRQVALARSAQVHRAKANAAEVAAGKLGNPTFTAGTRITKAPAVIAKKLQQEQQGQNPALPSPGTRK